METLVVQPNWREVLYNLVGAEQLDPWNIDICNVADAYLLKIKALKAMDLQLPANVILAASILLRFKVETLSIDEKHDDGVATGFFEDVPVFGAGEALTLHARFPPKRRVTLNELVQALQEAFEFQKKRKAKHAAVALPEPLTIEMPRFNMEQRISEVYRRAKSMADGSGLVLFSNLLCENTPLEKVFVLLPLLHLAQEEKLDVWQDRFFDEIFIKVLTDGSDAAG